MEVCFRNRDLHGGMEMSIAWKWKKTYEVGASPGPQLTRCTPDTPAGGCAGRLSGAAPSLDYIFPAN